jgi:hypothetical protein
MYGNMTALNQLGLGDLVARIVREPELTAARKKDGDETDDLVFAASLREAISAVKEQQDSQGIEASTLARIYRTAVIPGFSTTTRVSDPIINSRAPDDEDDTVSTDPTDSTAPTDPTEDETTTSAPTSSISEVVFSTGYSNTELLSRINNANTIDERLGYAAELRDKIVTALNNAGYTAAAAESADKLTVDGKTYDVIKASKGIGRNTAIQLLEVETGAGAASHSNSVVDAIFKAGESGLSLLRQISASFSVSERKHLASQIQQMMVDHLNANGYTASTTDSPDKIVVDGVTYDVIRGLNAPGQQAQYQAMKV